MTVDITINENEYYDIIKHLPVYSDIVNPSLKIKKRIDLAKVLAEKCNVPLDSIDSVILDTDDWITEVYKKGVDE